MVNKRLYKSIGVSVAGHDLLINITKIYINAQITNKCDIQQDKLIFLWVTGISWTIELFFFHKINIKCIINLTWYKRLNFAG
jgi:hypothetical protein